MRSNFKALTLLTCLALPAMSQSAEVVGGVAQGDNPSPWLASIQFIKFDLTSRIPVSIKSGDSLPAPTLDNPAETVTVPQIGSMAWCDPEVNPLEDGKCLGSTAESQFVVLDLNKARKKGAQKAYLRLTLKAYDDGNHAENDADDDLVPALTVFQGRQEPGDGLSWYPNKYQNDAGLVGWKLTPFTGKTTNNSLGWTTAYLAQGSLHKAVLTGKLTLKSGNRNYLTVAIGGDTSQDSLASRHLVNFQLDVEVDSKPLSANGGSSSSDTIDLCGCTIGVNQWHPSMHHCMSIAACEPLIGTSDHCKTPEMCAIDGKN